MLLSLSLLSLLGGAHALWPLPTQITNGSSFLQLDPSFSITLDPSISSSNVSSSLQNAVNVAMSQINNDSMYILAVGRGASDASAVNSAPTLSELSVSFGNGTTIGSGESQMKSIQDETNEPVEDWDESYTLSITTGSGSRRRDTPTASITASSSLGLLRGLQTFTQLVYTLPDGSGTKYIPNAPYEIEDAPAFPWRGFLLDTARNFFPVDDIKRQMDAMSWAKLNVFNWHVTDSQSWPLTVQGYENLTSAGAYSAAQIYSSEDIQDIISYGQSLGITTVMEIDTPGHTASIADAYPSYVACNVEHPWGTFANEPPSGQIRFAVPEVQTFINSVMSSVLQTIPGAVWSTGGDELNTVCYADDPVMNQTLTRQNETLEQALTKFVLSEHATVRSFNKTPAVWEEMALDHEVGKYLGNDTVVLVWISSEDAKEVVEMGLRIVQVPSNYFYLDCGGGGWITGNPDGNSWCDPFKTWQKIYSFEPYANLTTDQYALVLGGSTALWTEQSDPSNIDPIVWPRAAAAGELFWTGQAQNASLAIARLHDWRYRAVQRGVKAIALQPEWCALRPNQCLET